MFVPIVAGLLGFVTVVVALIKDRPLDVPGPEAPDWGELPAPDDVTRVSFPLAMPGYDPAHVESHLEAVRRAYQDVLDVLPPEILERARFRAALRAGREHVAVDEAPPAPPVLAPQGIDSDAEALRTVAALSRLMPEV